MTGEHVTTAAGGIVWRRGQTSNLVLVVHSARSADWTFPRGFAESGVSLQQAAVRAIADQTGAGVRLVHPLSANMWVARPHGTEVPEFTPNEEVDEIRWVRPRDAVELLTNDHDRTLLNEWRDLRDKEAHRTRTLVIMRHAEAEPRDSFVGEDVDRPLTPAGVQRAHDVVPILRAYGIKNVTSSPATRCVQTAEVYASSIGSLLEIDDRLSEDTKPGVVARSVEAIIDRRKRALLCTHRPTLPWVFDALGLEPIDLHPGQAIVVHHRKGHVFTTEPLA